MGRVLFVLQAGAAFSIMSSFKSSLPQEFKYLQEKYVGGLVVGWLHQILQINVVFPEKYLLHIFANICCIKIYRLVLFSPKVYATHICTYLLHQILQINVVFPEKASGQIQASGASEK